MGLNNKPKFGAAFFNEDGKLIDAVLYPDSLPSSYNSEKLPDADELPQFQKPRPWIKEIESYCQQQGITPQELIDLHKQHINKD